VARVNELSLRSGFLRSCERFAERPALLIDGATVSYADLARRAAGLAATLAQAGRSGEPPLTAVFAHRSATAFAGVLATLFRGHGYVPLNPTFPPARTADMLRRASCRSVIVDGVAEAQLNAILGHGDATQQLLLVLADKDDAGELVARWPQHRFIGSRELAHADMWQRGPVSQDDVAYLLFTSGSTGVPKGVMVAHRNATSFCRWAADAYGVTEHDRFSQMFEMTFDLSVFDMFVAWERGACVCAASRGDTLTPAQYVLRSGLTVWFSVPSTGLLMKKLGMLAPNLYPNLRLSLFCGEALPAELIEAWARAAPNSVVENLYGPTELTVACTRYRWDPAHSPSLCERGIVPIGEPFNGMQAFVADEQLSEVATGETGELLMSGPQLSPGYFNEPERTRASFVQPPGRQEVHYRTGDLVRRPAAGGPLVYRGRMDDQVKIHGYRVELGEIEAVLRQEAKVDMAVAVAWPRSATGADGIVAFLVAEDVDTDALRTRMATRLPSYMVPGAVHLIRTMPLGASGKVDRSALIDRLQTGL
jgi:amino acid adenylation domain-containing protein